MTQEELKIEYDKHKDHFDIIKQKIESKVVKIETYKGVFYELFPFSYQREGFKQGKPIENMHRIKSTNELFTYGFNDKGNIVEVREGISLKDQFDYQFLFYEKQYAKSLEFNNNNTLQNIRFYFYDNENRIEKMYSKGRMGGKEEDYHYDKNGILEKIIIRQFDRSGKEADTLIHSFGYEINGSLKSIIKSAVGNSDYSKIIFPPHQ